MQAGSDWEQCKENIQPLKKGRVMANLQSGLLPPGESSVRDKQKREYEVLLRSYVGEDPLEPWHAYILWTEQHYPKGGKEGSIYELLQRCILTFKDDLRYTNDIRFVDICLKFADLAQDVLEVYQYMYSANIGVKTAVFYRSWALQHESLGNIKKADELFLEGIARGAEPKEELEMYHKQFSARVLNNMHEQDEPTSPQEMHEEHRTTLGGLKAIGKKHRVGATRTGVAKTGNSKGVPVLAGNGSNSQARFPIFCDENGAPPSALPPKLPVPVALPAMASAKKENERKPDKWINATVRQTVSCTPNTNQKAFSIHVDENTCTPQQTPRPNVLPHSNVLSSRKADYKDSLGGLRQTAELKDNCQQKPMYCKEKLFCGVTEFQFEELRATRWWKRHAKLEEERMLKERELRIKKREEDIEILTIRLRSIMAKGGDGMLEEVAKCVKLMEGLNQEANSEQLEEPRVQEDVCENNVVPQFKDADSECSSVTSSQTKTSRSATPSSTGSTSHFVRAMWNVTLAEGDLGKTPLTQEPVVPKPASRKKCAFTIYGDEGAQNCVPMKIVTESSNTENPMRGRHLIGTGEISAPADLAHCGLTKAEGDLGETLLTKDSVIPKPTSSRKCAFTVYVDEDAQSGGSVKNLPMQSSGAENPLIASHALVTDENSAPAALTRRGLAATLAEGASNKQDLINLEIAQIIPPRDSNSIGTVKGILQPFAEVPQLSNGNEVAFEQTDNDFMMEGIAMLPGGDDITMNLPSHTAFMNNLKISSTPSRSTGNQTLKLAGTQAESGGLFKTPGARLFAPMTDFQRYLLHTKGDLSTISEASNEYRSSSSSSSSSAPTSHFKSQFLRNKTQDETSTNADKTDKSRGPALNGECDPPDFSDPFKVEVTEEILYKLPRPLTSRSGYCELERALPVVKEKSPLRLVNDMYNIGKLCNTGGFAKIFCGSELGFSSVENRGKQLAFKVQRPACRWEFYICSELLARIKQLDNPVDVTPSIMQISKMYVYKNGSILVTDYHNHGTLLDVVNHFTSRNAPFPEPLVLYITIEMLYIIEALHACHIIHADVKPDNFLVMTLSSANINVAENTFEKAFGGKTRCLKLIDFGRSIDMTAFPPGTTFTKSVQTDMFECCEMKEGRPWTYQTDFYGLASCSYTLLFGSYMKTVKEGDSWKIGSVLKRYWHQAEWTNYFHQLLNVPNCGSQPDLTGLRQSLEKCLITRKVLSELCSTLNQLEVVFKRKRDPSFP